jgi:hypothetical protein
MSYSFPPAPGSRSPWGPIQHVTPLGAEAVAVSTASHGGVLVAPTALSRIPPPLRFTAYSQGGWFEEDCDWSIPYLALGLDRFETEPGRGDRMGDAARRTLWACHRDHAPLLGLPADAGGKEEGEAGKG